MAAIFDALEVSCTTAFQISLTWKVHNVDLFTKTVTELPWVAHHIIH